MVQLLEELPPELLAHIAGTIVVAAAGGRWAQASRASRLLLLPRLDQLLERGGAALRSAAGCARQAQPPAPWLSCRPRGLPFGQWRCCNSCATAPFGQLHLHCCPGGDVLLIGYRLGCGNVQRHLTSKTHWTSYRWHVHGLGFGEAAWRSFVARASEFADV